MPFFQAGGDRVVRALRRCRVVTEMRDLRVLRVEDRDASLELRDARSFPRNATAHGRRNPVAIVSRYFPSRSKRTRPAFLAVADEQRGFPDRASIARPWQVCTSRPPPRAGEDFSHFRDASYLWIREVP
jgi:hypothetical protein